MNIYVANLDEDITEDDVEQVFSKYGLVESVSIWIDFETGRSKGFGFVEMPDEWDAERAIEGVNGCWWYGKRLKASKSRTQSW